MADPNHKEIFIIKRHVSHDSGHHGGAWKIAFADFMTAMMALFLVLWLISSTSDKTKHTVAQYFNPVKLVDMTTLKKGFRDPKETEMGSGPNIKASPEESDTIRRNPIAKAKEETKCQEGPSARVQAEAALFRDPYAVLADISATASVQAAKLSPKADSDTGAAPADTQGFFTDPFSTTPHEPEKPQDGLVLLAPEANVQDISEQGKELQAKETLNKDASAKDVQTRDEPVRKTDLTEGAKTSVPESEEEQKAPSQQANQHEALSAESQSHAERSQAAGRPDTAAAKLKSEILNAMGKSAQRALLPHVEVQATAEGLLISLTDDANFSMFAIGSAEPRPQTVQAVEKIGQILKAGSGSIIIRGHTDGRPYRSPVYDNWRLSSARAQMALYMLVRGGVNEKRFENVEGFADHRLKVPNNPNASENRRIEILLRKEKS